MPKPRQDTQASPAGTTEPTAVADFERSLDELEGLVQKMERGEMSLEDSLQAYERGMHLYRSCQGALEQAELRMRLMSDPLDPESATPFDPPT